MEYMSKIKMKVTLAKKRAIEEFAERKDHDTINVVSNKAVMRNDEKHQNEIEHIRDTFGGQNLRSN